MNTELTQTPVMKRANLLENAYWYAGTLMNVLVDGKQTNGRFAQIELITQPGSEPPVHTHTREDEALLIMDGEVRFTIGEHVFTAKKGDYVLMPKGIPHTFKVLSETAKAILTISPAGFENYFRDPRMAKPAPTLALPPTPQGPPPADVVKAMAQMLEQEYGVII